MKTEVIEHCIKVYVQGGSSKIYDVRCVEANKARSELAALKEENERLRAFHAVAPLPGWFKDAIEGVIMPDEKWLIDYAGKHEAAYPKGVGDGEARP